MRREGNERVRDDGSKLTGYMEGPASSVQVLNTLMMKHLWYDTIFRIWWSEHQDDVRNQIMMQYLFLGILNILRHEYGICNYKAFLTSSLSENQNEMSDSLLPVHATLCHTSTFHPPHAHLQSMPPNVQPPHQCFNQSSLSCFHSTKYSLFENTSTKQRVILVYKKK